MMQIELCILALAVFAVSRAYAFFFLPPSTIDAGIPVVPIWVAWVPMIRKALGLSPLPQDAVYRRYLEPRLKRFGVAAVFFGGRWNLVFAHPDGIRHIFRGNGSENDIVAKSGNHLKIPDAVISQLTGSNIISEHAEVNLAASALDRSHLLTLISPPLPSALSAISKGFETAVAWPS